MSRFIQNSNRETKPTKATVVPPKFGGKNGNKDYTQLANVKKIISPQGGSR